MFFFSYMHVLYETIDRKHNDAGALQYIKETPTKFYLSFLPPGHVRKVTFYNREMITSCFISFLHFFTMLQYVTSVKDHT